MYVVLEVVARGLGVKDLGLFSLVLLAKWKCYLFNDQDILWGDVLEARYGGWRGLGEDSYVGRLIKDEKIIVVDMTKSMVKPRNILLTLKEHNGNSYTTIKQV